MATKFIMKGRSSESAVAGKMVVSSASVCSLEDIPADINPEDMINEVRKTQETHETEEVKMYQIRSDTREVTEEEKEGLSESMKSECAGKTVLTSSIETVSEEDFANIFNRSLKRVNNNDILQEGSRSGCTNLFVR